MKITNNVLAIALGAVSTLLVSTGCTTVLSHGGEIIAATPPNPENELTTLIYVDSVGMNTRISVTETKKSDENAIIASKIKSVAEGDVLSKGFSIYSDNSQKPEIDIRLNVNGDVFDKSGNYFVVDSSISGSISTFPGTTYGRLVDNKIFPVSRGDRVLGLNNAYSVSADKASASVSSWLSEKLSAKALGVGVADLQIRRRALRASKDPTYIVEFVDKVSKLDGVFSCAVIEDDKANRIWKLHIVYDIAKFPAGVLNYLIGVKDLNLEKAPTTLF